MPVSIVVGGQFGSEGKGKVALEIVRRNSNPTTVVRVGGPNSGHTAYDKSGRKWELRQMPAACVDLDVDVVFPAGSYLDVDVLLNEVDRLDFPNDRIFISPYANIIAQAHKDWEQEANLVSAIGSTGSGVGAAVMALTAREAVNFPLPVIQADVHDRLQPFLQDTTLLLRNKLRLDERIVIEGSQGFGLSLLDGGFWPKATSRLTTAAGALAETGISPRDVDDVTLVLRSFPIRVAGDSGPLVGETTWQDISKRAGREDDLTEFTTVTQKMRRVGEFEPNLVKQAVDANKPSRIVLNHLDYIGQPEQLLLAKSSVQIFVDIVENTIGQKVDWYGFSGRDVIENRELIV